MNSMEQGDFDTSEQVNDDLTKDAEARRHKLTAERVARHRAKKKQSGVTQQLAFTKSNASHNQQINPQQHAHSSAMNTGNIQVANRTITPEHIRAMCSTPDEESKSQRKSRKARKRVYKNRHIRAQRRLQMHSISSNGIVDASASESMTIPVSNENSSPSTDATSIPKSRSNNKRRIDPASVPAPKRPKGKGKAKAHPQPSTHLYIRREQEERHNFELEQDLSPLEINEDIRMRELLTQQASHAEDAVAIILFEARNQSTCHDSVDMRPANQTRLSEVDDDSAVMITGEANRNVAYNEPIRRLRSQNTYVGPIQPSRYVGRKSFQEFIEADHEQHQMSSVTTKCKKCHAIIWDCEKSRQSCCHKGKILIQTASLTNGKLPEYMQYFNDTQFVKNIRKFNTMFNFTSICVKEPDLPGIPAFILQGQLTHRIGSLYAQDGARAIGGQIYILDTNDQVEARCELLRPRRGENPTNPPQELERHRVEFIQDIMQTHNPYAAQYLNARERIQQLEASHQSVGNLKYVIKHVASGAKSRTYNIPSAAEIAVIMEGSGDTPHERDIVLNVRDTGRTVTLNDYNSHYDPLQYPLLFPTGQQGWHCEIDVLTTPTDNGNTEKHITVREFYNYFLYERDTDFSYILRRSGMLFKMYFADMYQKYDNNNLNFIRRNQATIHRDLYQGVVDAAAERQGLSNIGLKTILPSSFTGSKRYMARCYQDAMAIVRKFGKPCLFITFTCNPNWQDITDRLVKPSHDYAHKQQAHERDDIIVRVFREKLSQLEKDLYTKHVLGKVAAFVRVVEFQKRGLPHAHMLLIMEDDSKIRNTSDIDRVTCARIPDKETNPVLYNIVTNNMIHTCRQPRTDDSGNIIPDARSCIVNGKCKKGFPKPLAPTTTMNHDGYPIYCRLNEEDRYCVPYNPYLAHKYDCHINVEVCTSIESVKYIYKYIYKGHDRIQIRVAAEGTSVQGVPNQEPRYEVDEVQDYKDARYVSSVEAIYRLMDIPLQKKSHSVTVLSLHLKDMHHVSFHRNESVATVLERGQKPTTLTAYFAACAQDPPLQGLDGVNAHDCLYHDMPMYFLFKNNVWVPRKNHSKVIGRIVAASPREVERFYLRMLLCHIRGPTSFENLRTVNGQLHSTYRTAAIALGLLKDDSEYHECMRQASIACMPIQLRELFVNILALCQPKDPGILFQDNKEHLMEDFKRQHDNDENIAMNMLLQSIDKLLQCHGLTLKDFHCPTLPSSSLPQLAHYSEFGPQTEAPPSRYNRLHQIETTYEPAALDAIIASGDTMTVEHALFVEKVLQRQGGHVFFLQGEGGSGKSYVLQILLATVRKQKRIAIAVASSGLAALLLMGGTTAHSRFNIPVSNLDEKSTCYIRKQTDAAAVLRQTELIVWDECSMIHKHAIEAVDRTLRDIMEKANEPFGGITIVFSGDFKQILPVVPRGTEGETIEASIKRSLLWRHVSTFNLTRNMRLVGGADDESVAEWARTLVQIGNGTYPTVNTIYGPMIRLPDGIAQNWDNLSTFKSFIREIYGEINTVANKEAYLSERAILTPKNDFVDKFNAEVLRLMNGDDIQVFKSIDTVEEDDENFDINAINYQPEILNSLKYSGLPPHELELRVGCPIMLLRNICQSQGLCNGSRLIVQALSSKCITASIVGGSFNGKKVFIPRITIIDDGINSRLPFRVHRHQFPVRLAFAMTINKSQGQTLKTVGIVLPDPVFSHGQLYVALSRAKTKQGISMLVQNGKIEGLEGVYTSNIVYRQVFQD